MRSRAVSLPLACCASMRRSPPPARAAARFSSSSAGCRAFSPRGCPPKRHVPAIARGGGAGRDRGLSAARPWVLISSDVSARTSHEDRPDDRRLRRRADRVAPGHARASRAGLRGAAHRRLRGGAGSRAFGSRGRDGHRAAPAWSARCAAAARARAIGLRADMDALPIHEANGFAHASRTPGACMAAAMTATPPCCSAPRASWPHAATSTARCTSSSSPPRRARAAAQAMIEDGLFERFPARRLRLHNWPDLAPAGHRRGPGRSWRRRQLRHRAARARRAMRRMPHDRHRPHPDRSP